MPKESIRKELIDLLGKLITIPSTHSRPHDIQACGEFICSWLDQYQIPYKKQFSKETPSILVLPQSGFAPILLMSHFDVVEVDDITLFQPRIEGDKLFGRGSIDDKYGVALSLILLREHYLALCKMGKGFDSLPFGLLLTGDEETGGLNGAKIAAQNLSTDFFIAIDGGRPDLIVTKEKGILVLELRSQGKAAHAARPWLGISAFDLLNEDYQKIQSLFLEDTPDHWHKTMVMTKCRVGNGSTNMVPESASALFDIRYTENDDPNALVKSIREMVQSDVIVHAMEPVFTSGTSPLLDLLIDHSGGARVGFEHGASDARYLSQMGIPGAIWGADGEMSQHSRHEHIVLSSLSFLYDRFDSYFHTMYNT